MNSAEPKLKELVGFELEAANQVNPPFHSAHEGYAVILEELDETEDALDFAKKDVVRIWDGVKANLPLQYMAHAVCLEKHAVRVAAEAIQVAAMARKFRALGGERHDDA